MWGPRCAGGRRGSAGALLEQLAERGDINLRHLERLGLGQLLVALQVGDDAPQPVEGNIEPEHPPPLTGVGSEASPSLRPLQSALVRLEVVQRAAGGAQAELHDGAGRVLVVVAASVSFCPLALLCAAVLQQSVDVGVEGYRGPRANPSLRIHGDERRKEAFTRRHCTIDHKQFTKKFNFPHFDGRIYGGGSLGDAQCVSRGRGQGRVLPNEQSQRVRGRRSINQVHQKRIRSVSVRRCGPIHGGGQAEQQQGQEGRKQGEMRGRMDALLRLEAKLKIRSSY